MEGSSSAQIHADSRATDGQILVIFVLALVAIIAGVGLVIDGGFAFARAPWPNRTPRTFGASRGECSPDGADANAAARAAAAAQRLAPMDRAA